MRLLTLCLLVVAGPCLAQTMWRWVDADGSVHYTDDRSQIPQGVKAQPTEGSALSEINVGHATPPLQGAVRLF